MTEAFNIIEVVNGKQFFTKDQTEAIIDVIDSWRQYRHLLRILLIKKECAGPEISASLKETQAKIEMIWPTTSSDSSLTETQLNDALVTPYDELKLKCIRDE